MTKPAYSPHTSAWLAVVHGEAPGDLELVAGATRAVAAAAVRVGYTGGWIRYRVGEGDQTSTWWEWLPSGSRVDPVADAARAAVVALAPPTWTVRAGVDSAA